MTNAERFEALESWADVIVESLHEKDPARGVDPRALREVRELSWALRNKLYVLRTQLEFSKSEALPT